MNPWLLDVAGALWTALLFRAVRPEFSTSSRSAPPSAAAAGRSQPPPLPERMRPARPGAAAGTTQTKAQQ